MKQSLRKFAAALLLIALLLPGLALAATVYGADGDSYIRSSPNLSGAVLGSLPKGASATLQGQSTDDRGVTWYKISYNGATGWVSSMYTSLDGSASFSAQNGVVAATGGDSYIRDTHYRSGKELGTLAKGQVANYLGQSATDERGVIWYRISYGTITGWVSSRYTELRAAGSTTAYTASWVSGDGGNSNIRNAPNLSANEVGLLPQGASASYLGQTQYDARGVAWYYISYNGVTGWVSSKYTSLR